MRLGLLASGRGSNVRAILEAIGDGRLDADAAIVICDRREAAVLGVAARHGVPAELVERSAYVSRSAWQAAIGDLLARVGVEVVALAGFGAILDHELVDRFAGRVLNIHPSLLPAFAGTMAPEPQAAALRAGVKLTGCTVHVVTPDVDAGPIVAQSAVPVLPDDSVETLSRRILAEEHRLYPTVLQWFAEGRVRVESGRVLIDHEPARTAAEQPSPS